MDDGLAQFEKALAAEKAERDQERDRDDRKRRKHRHDRDDKEGESRHRHRSHRHDGDDKRDDRDEHRHKRSRHSRHHDDDDRRSKEHRDHRDRKEHRSSRHHSSRDEDRSKSSRDKEHTARDETKETSDANSLQRDSWMTAPSAIDIDYVHRRDKNPAPSPPKAEPKRVFHERELNQDLQTRLEEADDEAVGEIVVDYKFGDDGSQWRMTKLKAVYSTAERDNRAVDDVALERYGTLQEFDIAREEREELDRRRLYGKGYTVKEGPTGEIYNARATRAKKERRESTSLRASAEQPSEAATVIDEVRQAPAATMDQTSLNRLRAQMMKAKLRRDPDAARLEAEYNKAAAAFAEVGPKTVALGAMENRMLAGPRGEVKSVQTKRGQERGTLEDNEDMTVEQMLQEERRTKNLGGGGGESMRLAERIAKDGRFDNDLEYMDENAEKLAKRVHKSEVNLKNLAINEFQKMNRILDKCPLCIHDDTGRQPVAPVVSLGTRAYLTLATEPEIAEGSAVIVPLAHRANLLECDDDEWEEVRNFMKSLTRMYHDQGREVVFYENAAAPHRHPHAAMTAVPIPYEEGETIPAYFKEAFLSSDEEWSQHRKIIDTGAKAREGMGRAAFRRSIAKEMPYFHVWFTLDGGLGHIVENADQWPKGDLFAREVLGGVMDVGPEIIKKQGRWHKGDTRVEGFRKRWRKFDWTRVLEEQ